MPMYTFTCEACETTAVKMCPMPERDNQNCDSCGNLLKRGIDRPGRVWSPTRNGGTS